MDLYLFNIINGVAGQSAGIDFLGIFFAKYLEYFMLAALLLFLLFRFGKFWKTVIASLTAAILARMVIVNIIRWIWARPRPFIHNNINLLLNYPDKAAFPSGHAAFYFAISSIVFAKNKNAGALFFAGTVLICLGRVFVGIHWPADILAGAIVGLFSGWLIKKFFKKL